MSIIKIRSIKIRVRVSTLSFGSGHDNAYGVRIQRDGKIVTAGWTHNGVNYDYGLARYEGDPVASHRAPFDFDSDGRTDISIFRPSAGEWWINLSSSNVTIAAQFGDSSVKLVPADYTGDGRNDIAFFRPSDSHWYVLRSEDFSFYAFPFGTSGDKAMPADYDGDGRADAAVFRPSNATWYLQRSSSGFEAIGFGIAGDVPVPSTYVS